MDIHIQMSQIYITKRFFNRTIFGMLRQGCTPEERNDTVNMRGIRRIVELTLTVRSVHIINHKGRFTKNLSFDV